MENICDLILQKRKERGLTQAELGTMLGISGKAVSKWERGLSKPCDEHLERLIDLLGLPVNPPITAEWRSHIKPPFYLPSAKNSHESSLRVR